MNKKKAKRPWSRMAAHEAAISRARPAIKRVQPASEMDQARAVRAALDARPGLSEGARRKAEMEHNNKRTKR